MLHIVTGRTGSGKSGKCITEFNAYLQKHSAADTWAYFFVPEQYTIADGAAPAGISDQRKFSGTGPHRP